jgi:hypothetical protein
MGALIGGVEYGVVVMPGRLFLNGRERMCIIDHHAHVIQISDAVSVARRRDILAECSYRILNRQGLQSAHHARL